MKNDLREKLKDTVLRPLADKFQELTRQIDSGEYELPKTIQEAEKITEGYIDQAWERIEPLVTQEKLALLDEVMGKVIGEIDTLFVDDKQIHREELRAEQRQAWQAIRDSVSGGKGK